MVVCSQVLLNGTCALVVFGLVIKYQSECVRWRKSQYQKVWKRSDEPLIAIMLLIIAVDLKGVRMPNIVFDIAV